MKNDLYRLKQQRNKTFKPAVCSAMCLEIEFAKLNFLAKARIIAFSCLKNFDRRFQGNTK